MRISCLKYILCLGLKYKLKSAVYVMLLAIAHKNTEIQHLLNVQMPICGPRLDEKSFSTLVCLPLNTSQTYNSSNKSVCFHFNTQADIILAGDEL